ncbi:hypothetical protein D9758_010226 [Tetrapyrgos nigripes]|uniref:D-lactate dehydrogenase (cytochrome) n=1 Tax=Tetrapyrgos nigripes TaxID=182062 RepID=A0A8H5CXI5_9AGAR|nr:hypothetical protein D9758_010226 [Tetrapyrgos nigripes]
MFSTPLRGFLKPHCSRFKLSNASTTSFCRQGTSSTRPTRFIDSRSMSSASSNTSSSFTPRNAAIVLGLSLTSAMIGYHLAQSSRTTLPSKPKFGTPADFDKAIDELRQAFHDDADIVSTDTDDLRLHGFSENDYHPGSPHTVVVYPRSTEDVVKVVKIATKYRMPIIAYAGATSLEGHFRGHAKSDSDLVCQPGIGWVEINDTLKEKGIPLFFPIDPAPGATIGGMLSTGCSGTNAVRYGTSKGEWFLNATVVLPSGEVIKTRRRSRKSSAGFDVTKLFIGAEGTLGIVTEVTIRLAPVLPTTVAVVHFPNVKKATEAVIEVMSQGVGIQCVELLDDIFMHAINTYGQSSRKWPEMDSLFFKIQGHNKSSLKEYASIIKTIVEKHGGTGFQLAKDDKEAADLWADRKNALYSGLAIGPPGARGWSTDVCVPVSKLPELVYETKKDLASIGLVSTIVGHVGDGNFHSLILFSNDKEWEIARGAVTRMVQRAIQMDGTCTGEHGVGIGKKKFLVEELGPGTVELMRTIKRAVDPLGLFNPGKLYPDEDETKGDNR